MNRTELVQTLSQINEGLFRAWVDLEPYCTEPASALVRDNLRQQGLVVHELVLRLDANENITAEVISFEEQVRSYLSAPELAALRDLAEVAPTLVKIAHVVNRLSELVRPAVSSFKSQQRPAGAHWFRKSTRRQSRPVGTYA